MEHMRNIVLRKEIYARMTAAWRNKADYPERKLVGADDAFLVRFSSDTDTCKHDCFASTASNDLLCPEAPSETLAKWIKTVMKAVE